MVQKDKRILLHTCCGVCSGYPISYLKDLGYSVVAYFCNPNLDTEDEFLKRLSAQQTVCKYFEVDLITEPYNHKEYLDFINGLENEPEKGMRCEKCIEIRLLKSVQKAKELKITEFTTTLTVSPHKNSEKIFKIAENICSEHNIQFLEYNFKKQNGFIKTNEVAHKLDIYRQKYCGCEFAKKHLEKLN
ncbi:MAG: epoxyqueuosine reductase QueH [Cyanobacteria bacterium SIG28]|nr:epoxyqueuosine reductase QueH [Cyanobacteria bacterium SIG28]